jgi:hypothetical protein
MSAYKLRVAAWDARAGLGMGSAYVYQVRSHLVQFHLLATPKLEKVD